MHSRSFYCKIEVPINQGQERKERPAKKGEAMEERYYQAIIEELIKLMEEGVYIVDRDGVGVFYNDSMAEIEQISVSDVVGKEYHKAFPGVKPADSTMFKALKKGLPTRSQQQSYRNLYGREVTTVNSTVPV